MDLSWDTCALDVRVKTRPGALARDRAKRARRNGPVVTAARAPRIIHTDFLTFVWYVIGRLVYPP